MTSAIGGLVPSYILKAGRAEKHLHDLKVEIARWAETHPYHVVTGREGKRQVHRLRFTSSPPPEIGMIAADFVYNLRSGLDHLMGALVPRKQRSNVYFPVYFEGVWDSPVPGENQERAKARSRWESDTAKMKPEAVAILKSLQPAKGTRDDNDAGINAFLLLNRVSNTDRHQKIPVVFSALRAIRLLCKDLEGNAHAGPADLGGGDEATSIAKDGTELCFPPGAVEMNVAGTPVVALAIPSPKADVDIPGGFDLALHAYWERAVNPLIPYLHPD